MPAAPIPTTPAERVDTLDMLRGLALFGVMAINVVWGFRVNIFQRLLSEPSEVLIDRVVETFLWLFVSGKALAIFSLLFGVGLGILAERVRRTDRALVLLLRRLTALLAFGLVHALLIWNGDILTEYAIAGFVALPFVLGPRRLLVGAALFFLVVSLLFAVFWQLPSPDQEWLTWHIKEALFVHRTGDFFEVVALQFQELPYVVWWHIYSLPRTIAWLLLGALIWRSELLRAPLANARLLKAAALIGIASGLGLGMAGWAIWNAGTAPVAANLLWDSSIIVLALGYSAAIVVIAASPRARKLIAWAAPLGRMAFTNYLAQSVIFALVFFGYGLGMFMRWGIAQTFAFGTAVYVLQAVLSAYWLRHHRFGPMEWLWRTATYGTRQPWKVDQPATPPPSAPPPADRS